MLPVRAPLSAAYTGVLGSSSAVGLDAGRGTTRVVSVESALHPELRASGATASITDTATG